MRGLLWMAAAGPCLIAVTAGVKHAAQDLPAAPVPVPMPQPVTVLPMIRAVLRGWTLVDEPPGAPVIPGGAVIDGAASMIA